jgi:hypothetical protein
MKNEEIIFSDFVSSVQEKGKKKDLSNFLDKNKE